MKKIFVFLFCLFSALSFSGCPGKSSVPVQTPGASVFPAAADNAAVKEIRYPLSGTVILEENGEPVEGIVVTVKDDGGEPLFSAVTDFTGEYVFKFQRQGTYTVVFGDAGSGFEVVEKTIEVPQMKKLDISLKMQDAPVR